MPHLPASCSQRHALQTLRKFPTKNRLSKLAKGFTHPLTLFGLRVLCIYSQRKLSSQKAEKIKQQAGLLLKNAQIHMHAYNQSS
jgi:hypothetical protein